MRILLIKASIWNIYCGHKKIYQNISLVFVFFCYKANYSNSYDPSFLNYVHPSSPSFVMPWYILNKNLSKVKICKLASTCSSAVVLLLLFAQSTFSSISRHSSYSSSDIKYLLLLRSPMCFWHSYLLSYLLPFRSHSDHAPSQVRMERSRDSILQACFWCIHSMIPTLVFPYIRYSECRSLWAFPPTITPF